MSQTCDRLCEERHNRALNDLSTDYRPGRVPPLIPQWDEWVNTSHEHELRESPGCSSHLAHGLHVNFGPWDCGGTGVVGYILKTTADDLGAEQDLADNE